MWGELAYATKTISMLGIWCPLVHMLLMRANKLETALSRDCLAACLAPPDMFFSHALYVLSGLVRWASFLNFSSRCAIHITMYILFFCRPATIPTISGTAQPAVESTATTVQSAPAAVGPPAAVGSPAAVGPPAAFQPTTIGISIPVCTTVRGRSRVQDPAGICTGPSPYSPSLSSFSLSLSLSSSLLFSPSFPSLNSPALPLSGTREKNAGREEEEGTGATEEEAPEPQCHKTESKS